MKAEQVLTAEYDLTDRDLNVDNIDGLREAVNRVHESKERELVRCENRVGNYDVYWNSKTDAVRIGATFRLASYEVDPDDLQSE